MRTILFIILLHTAAYAASGGSTHGDFMVSGFLVSNDFNYNFYNPARCALFNRNELYLQRSSMHAGTGMYYGSLNWLTGAAGTVSAGWVRFGTDGIEVRNDASDTSPLATTADMYSVWLLSYAHRLLPSVSLGTNAKLVYRNLFGDKAAGFGADLGAVLIPTRFQFFDNFSFGLSLQNLIRPTLSYGWDGISGKETWPRNLRSAMLMTLFSGRLDLALAGSVINIIPDGTNPSSSRRFSLDYSLKFRPNRLMSIVLGYNNQTVRLGWMLGFKGNQDVHLMTTYNSFWGSTTHLAAAHRFGQTRDEKLLLLRARSGRFKAEETMQQAHALFEAEDWLNAVLKFKEVILLFPKFAEQDKAFYYLGECYRHLQLPFGAAGTFTELVEDHPQSAFREQGYHRLAGLYAAAGRQGELNAVYQTLKNSMGTTQASQKSQLELGKSLFRADTSSSAMVILSAVPEESPFYHTAQYYCAARRVQKEEYAQARIHLANILRTSSPETFRQPDLAVTALSAMANSWFESGEYDSALAFYDRVPAGSRHALQARLGKTWCRYHLAQYDTMLTGLDALEKEVPLTHPYFYEIRFLAGQGHYLAGHYPQAESIFTYLTGLSLSDTVFAGTDTSGLDARRRAIDSVSIAAQAGLDAFDRELYAHPFYKPLPADKRNRYREHLRVLADAGRSLDSLSARIDLYNSRTLWMGNAYDMVAKASRAVTEARLYRVYMKYTPRIKELEKKLYEMVPTGFAEDAAPVETSADDVEVEKLDESEKERLLQESDTAPAGQP